MLILLEILLEVLFLYLTNNKYCLIGSRINTGTFTRPKKNKDKVSPTGGGVDVPDAPIHHPNVTDIENLAKQQEESLRQSIAQSSPRRGTVHLCDCVSLYTLTFSTLLL